MELLLFLVICTMHLCQVQIERERIERAGVNESCKHGDETINFEEKCRRNDGLNTENIPIALETLRTAQRSANGKIPI